jgi:hypothetical protein
MIKRILANIFLAFLILPGLKLGADYIKFEAEGDHSLYSGSFLEYEKLIWTTVFVVEPFMFSLLVLLPYNVAILRLGIRRLIKKIITFEIIMLLLFCIAGLFFNIWAWPVWRNLYLPLYFFPISVLFSSFIHFLVDKQIEPSSSK